MSKTNLSKYNNDWFPPTIGASKLKQILWYYVNATVFATHLFPFSKLKVYLLKLFGAEISVGVVIKPAVNIKYPWKLKIGDHSWIGEKVWIDNLAEVKIGSHVCLSQGAFLLTGNHNYSVPTFDLTVKSIVLENGVWIGACAVVCPGVLCHTHSVLTVSSVAVNDLEPYSVYKGNPARKVRDREIKAY